MQHTTLSGFKYFSPPSKKAMYLNRFNEIFITDDFGYCCIQKKQTTPACSFQNLRLLYLSNYCIGKSNTPSVIVLNALSPGVLVSLPLNVPFTLVDVILVILMVNG